MNPTSRIAQLYGYTICLISVVVLLFSANTLVESAFALRDPLLADAPMYGNFGPDLPLSSFEAFRAAYEGRFDIQVTLPEPLPGGSAGVPAPRSLSEAELRARYEALRADRTARNHFGAQQSLARSALMLVFAIALFITHWLWLRSDHAAP